MLFYTARYVCFMKISNKLLLLYLISDNIDYTAINKFLTRDVLFSLSGK